MLKFFVFRCQVKAQSVFNGEHSHRENIKDLKPDLVRLEHRRHMFEHQSEQVDNDQNTDPLVQSRLEVAGDVGIQKP